MSAIRAVWKPVALVAALSFLYASVLAKLGHDWWTDENYSHGLLIPFIIGYIIWTERDTLKRAASRPQFWWGGALVSFALLALWGGTAGAELFVQRISLVLMLAGVVIYFWGFKLLRLAFVPLVLLLLAIPIPTIIFNQLAFPLQLFASRCAVWVMRAFGIPVLRQGNVIELMPRGAAVSKKMEVVEACSGIRSLMTLMTLAVVFAYFTHPRRRGDGTDGTGQKGNRTGFFASLKSYGFWRSAILVLSAIPIAIVTNALRVSGTGVLTHYFGARVADGFFHYFSGWIVYLLAFILLMTIGWLLDRLSHLFVGREGVVKPVAQEKRAAKAESPAKLREKPAPPVEAIPVKGLD
ncbi:MAG TPA: exosortase/archaeosortase family protein [Pyrinomonadaceae bacterium]|jgi:exosortase